VADSGEFPVVDDDDVVIFVAEFVESAGDSQIRHAAIEEAHDTGMSYTEIAAALGLSKGRITQIRTSPAASATDPPTPPG
jgi:hypothetical protein